ncbi:MAG: acetate--CoA ligase family protein [Thermoleophilaceae bacterium]
MPTRSPRGAAGYLPPRRKLCFGHRPPVIESRSAANPHDVRRAAGELGGRVALKATGPDLLHKSDVGGVRLALTAAGAERAAGEKQTSLKAAGMAHEGFLVQRMAATGLELIVGVVGDPRFGPLVAVGAGGTTAELIGDVQVRLAPVGPREAATMLRELRTFPLLDGFRGAPRADTRALEDIIQRVAALAAAHPEIAELDCNPVVAGPDGAVIVDARVRLAPAPPRPPAGALNR